ncbi:sigma-54-dependent transcriptional regulator [Planctomycetota bacterium]
MRKKQAKSKAADRPVQVLVVDDEEPFRKLIERNLRRQGAQVDGAGTGERALELIEIKEYEVAILDIRMPGISGIELLSELKAVRPVTEAIVITGHATIDSAIEAMKLGAYDYVEKPLKMSELGLLVEKASEKYRLAMENFMLRDELMRREPPSEIVCATSCMAEVLSLIDTYAGHEAPVLILGESGTGKELAARGLHRRGPRAGGPFVAINCGALQETLLENELFGHTKGAFTGAVSDRSGLFEHADRGTLFIDEVCEMGPNLQKKFLRVLEDGIVRRLGDVAERSVSVRIVAATNRDLDREVREGRFREDLYYRLNVLPLLMPPLRDRLDDIELLAKHYLERFGRRSGRTRGLSAAAVARLRGHRWPGNVRELFNVLERALIVSQDGVVAAEDLPQLGPGARPVGDGAPTQSGTLEDIERRHVLRTLKETGGNKTQAARKLGISLRSLYRKLQRYGL